MKRKNQLKNQFITSVKVVIDDDSLSKFTRQRLRQILGRDTRIIKKYLNIIECYEDDLITKVQLKRKAKGKKFRFKVEKGELDLLTATTKHRPSVLHDFKVYFPRVSLNEMKECRDTACGIYLAYYESKVIQENSRKPKINKPLPRSIGYRRFRLNIDSNTLSFMDSMDSNLEISTNSQQKVRHDYLDLPLKISIYHRAQLQKGQIKSLRLKRVNQKYLAIFSIKQNTSHILSRRNSTKLPIAVVGLDLGISQDVAISVITKYGILQQQFITSKLIQNTKKSLINLENRISNIWKSINKNNEKVYNNSDGKFKLLRSLGNKRPKLKFEINHQITAEIIHFINFVMINFDVYIGIGELRGIRKKTVRGKATKSHRKRMHKWAFSQLTRLLQYKLLKFNSPKRFVAISEAYTSITCWKCGQRGNRPRQNYFVCINSSCGWRGHADFNGATNIAKRTASYFKLIPNLKPFFMTDGGSGLSPVNTRLKRRILNSTGVLSPLESFFVGPNAGVYDPSVIKVTENLSSMNSSSCEPKDEGEAEGSTDLVVGSRRSRPHSVPLLMRVKKSEWRHSEGGYGT